MTEEEIDRIVKINIRLTQKFKKQLLEEYGDSFSDILKAFDTLYQEQMEIMPLPYYKYGFGSK